VRGSVSELLKVRDDLTAERDDKVREIAGLREKVAASQESELKLEKERDEAQNKLQEVIIIIVTMMMIIMMMRERLRTYSNAFLSCYNASTPCFCTTLCQLTCRTHDHPTF